jgi:hypothetical protein
VPPDPAASTQRELWAGARFAGVEQARGAARRFEGRVDGRGVMAVASVAIVRAICDAAAAEK